MIKNPGIREGIPLRHFMRFLVFLLGILGFVFSSFAHTSPTDRYHLKKIQPSESGDSFSVVYLDTHRQRLITTTYAGAKDLNSYEGRFPEKSGSVATPWLETKGLSYQSFNVYDLKEEAGQEGARQLYRGLLGDELGEDLYGETLRQVSTGPSRYKLKQMGSRENTQVGVYYNDKTREFVFQSVSNKGSREHAFPRTVGLKTDLSYLPDDQTRLSFEALPSTTTYQFDKAVEELQDHMKEHGFVMPTENLAPLREAIARWEEGLNTVHKSQLEEGLFREVSYHPVTNELLVREYRYGVDGQQIIEKEELIDLNDQAGFHRANNFFIGLGEEGKDIKRDIMILSGGCEDPLQSSMASSPEQEVLEADIQKIMEELWKEQLRAGIASDLRVGEDNQAWLDIKLLGKTHSLRADFSPSGDLRDLNFEDPLKARDLKMRIRHLKDVSGKKQFMVQAFNEFTGEWEPQVVLETERNWGAFQQLIPQLAVYLNGQNQEGRFQFESFEKSTFDLNYRGTRLNSAGPRSRLNGEREDPYKEIHFKREGAGGLVNFAFHLFFSKNGRKQKVRENIIEEARKAINSTDYKEFINDRDIKQVAHDVTEAVALRTDNFDQSKNRIEAVAMEESYSRFSELLLSRLMANLLPDDPPESIRLMTQSVLADFRLCLKRASDARSSEMANRCMDTFMKEAPVEVGKEILKLKLTQAGLGDFSHVAEKDFLSCVQEKYDPVKKRLEGDNSIKVIQACLYRSLMTTVDQVAPALVDEKVGEIARDLDLDLRFTKERVSQAMEKVRSCVEQEGLAKKSARGFSTNFHHLQNLPPDLFEQQFMGCVDHLVEEVALDVARTALSAKLADVDLSNEARNRVIASSFNEGMVNCLEEQKTLIFNIRQNYQVRREVLERQQGVQADIKVDVIVPAFDPLECNKVLTNKAVGHSTDEMIKELLGHTRYDELKEEGHLNYASCFANNHSQLTTSIDDWLMENARLKGEALEVAKANRESQAEAKTAECVKKAISQASFYVAQDMVVEKLKENPAYANIELSSDLKNKIGLSIQTCFEESLAPYKVVDDILKEQEKLKDKCAVELLRDPSIQEDLFSPFVALSLSEIEMGGESRKALTGEIIELLAQELEEVKNLDEAMAKIDLVKPRAVPLVLNKVLREKVNELLPDSSEEERGNLISQVETLIFGTDGEGALGQKLIEAIETDNKSLLEQTVSTIEKLAADTLGESVIRSKGEELLESGVLDSKEDVDRLVEVGTASLKKCLEQPSLPSGIEEKERLDYCAERTTIEATEYLLAYKLEDRLKNHPLLSKVLEEEKRGDLLNQIVDDSVRARIEAVSKMEDGREKDQAMDRFILSFKMEATQKVFDEVINDIVDEKLPAPKYFEGDDLVIFNNFRDRIGRRAKGTLERCLNPHLEKLKQEAAQEGENNLSELDLDECLNKARLGATLDILPKRFEFILNYLYGDDRRVGGLVNLAKSGFRECASQMEQKVSASDYGAHLDGCLNVTIMDFVGSIVTNMREEEPSLLTSENPRTNWQACVDEMETRAREYVYQGSPPEDVIDLQSEKLYARLYKDGEALSPQRSPNLDWIIPQIIECGIQKQVPSLVLDFRDEFLERHKKNIDPPTEVFVMRLTESIHRIFSTTRSDGSPLVIDLKPLFGDPSERKTKLQAGPEVETEEDAPAVSKPKPILDVLKEAEPSVIKYLNMIAAYDQEGMREAISQFEKKAVERIGSRSGDVQLETVVDLLVESDLTDILIESMVAGIVRKEAAKALKEEGADPSVVWLLSSKEMIHRLFGTGEGKEVLNKIKAEYLKPLLMGKIKDMSLPEDLIEEAKMVLVKDTGVNGFVETLFGAIAQKNLTDKRDWIESGWGSIIRVPFAGLKGLNRYRDFVWGDRWNTQYARYHLRLTPSGKKATEHFAKKILGPMLKGELSESEKQRESKVISELIEKAMSEND